MCKNMYKMHTDWMLWWRFSLLAKPPPSTTQNGMFLSYNHHNNLKTNISIYTKCIQNISANIQNVYKI